MANLLLINFRSKFVSSLPGLYAFLGNDYTPASFGKVKVKSMKIAIKKKNC